MRGDMVLFMMNVWNKCSDRDYIGITSVIRKWLRNLLFIYFYIQGV